MHGETKKEKAGADVLQGSWIIQFTEKLFHKDSSSHWKIPFRNIYTWPGNRCL